MQYKPGNWVTGFKRSPRAANVQHRDMGLFLNSSGKFEPIDDAWDNLHSGGLFISDDNKLYFRDETNKDIYINSPAAETLGLSAGNATTAGFVTINEEGFDTDFRVEASGVTHALFVQGSDGAVGIGTGSPQVKHQIYESTANTNVAQRLSINYSTGAVYSGIEFAPSETGTVFGSIHYAHQTNQLQFSNSASGGGFGANVRMYIDSSGNVGIGATPGTVRLGQKLEVATSANYGGQALSTWSTSAAQAPALDFNRSKNATIGTHTAVSDDDALGWISFRGSDGVEFLNAAYIAAHVDGAVTGGGTDDMPGRLVFATAPDGGSGGTERMRIDSAGNVGIGTESPDIASDTSLALTMESATGAPYLEFSRKSDSIGDTGGMGRIRFFAGSSAQNLNAEIRAEVSGTSENAGYLSLRTKSAAGSLATAMTISAAGEITASLQPAFSAQMGAFSQSNIAIDTIVTITYSTEIFDQGADYNHSTYTFTAPVTGKYQFNITTRADNIDQGADYYQIRLFTSNRWYYSPIIDPGQFAGDVPYWSFSRSVLADMELGDTAYVAIYQGGGSEQTDLFSTINGNFSGYLVC